MISLNNEDVIVVAPQGAESVVDLLKEIDASDIRNVLECYQEYNSFELTLKMGRNFQAKFTMLNNEPGDMYRSENRVIATLKKIDS